MYGEWSDEICIWKEKKLISRMKFWFKYWPGIVLCVTHDKTLCMLNKKRSFLLWTILEEARVRFGIFDEFQSYLSCTRTHRWIYIFPQCKQKFMLRYGRWIYNISWIVQWHFQNAENLYIHWNKYKLNKICSTRSSLFIYCVNPLFNIECSDVYI